MSTMSELSLVWGTPGDVEMSSDGGGDYASSFRLTPRGIAKIMAAPGMPGRYRDAEHCGCRDPREGDGIHVPGEPSELICLASPTTPGTNHTDGSQA